MLWYQLAAKMYNMSGSLGRIDQFLYPYYERDKKQGILTDEEAVFHLCCYFLMDTSYTQVGGPDAAGNDITNPLSYLVLEAAHRLKIPVNVGVCVGKTTDPGLLRRGVEILFEDRTGIPKFLGVDRTSEGFARNGYPIGLGRERVVLRMPLVRDPRTRIHGERLRQDQPPGGVRRRPARHDGRPAM